MTQLEPGARLAFLLGMATCLTSACGDSDGGGGTPPVIIPPEATVADTRLKSLMPRVLPHVSNAHSGVMFIMNPDATLTPGITYSLDTQPGAPANRYVFDGTHDGNDDGVSETTLTGTVTFSADPGTYGWSPISGTTETDVNIPVLGHVYESTIAFTATAAGEVQLSGSGTFSDPVTGEVTTVAIPAGSPLVIKGISGTSGITANACGYSLSGVVPVEMAGPSGTLSTNWRFSPTSSAVAVEGTSFRNPAGQSTPMPDASVTLVCDSSGSIDDWVGVYEQDWVCLPIEHGRARLSLTVSNATTVSIDDEDPPGSGDSSTYTATIVGSSPHALQGYFDSGPVGNRYREYFTWTLDKNGVFTQSSTWAFTEGANIGQGGICAGKARPVS
jgi:hypothetical protein